jgi:hypothetical protein
MSDSRDLPPAGWFPDPEGSPRQRYWDGTAWTTYYHSPEAAPAFGPPDAAAVVAGSSPRTRRRRRVQAIVGGSVALVLAATSAIVFVVVPSLTAGVNGAIHDDPEWEYAYTDPMLDLAADHEFEVPADYDLVALSEAEAAKENPDFVAGEYSSDGFAFEVFFDAAFTKHADVTVVQTRAGDEISIYPNDPDSGWTAGDHEQRQIADAYGEWSLHEEYFIMRKLDRDGSRLDKPVVTRFTVEEDLDTPRVTFGMPENDGDITFSWEPVEGASNYLIVTSSAAKLNSSRDYTVLGETDGTTWSSAESSVAYNEHAPWVGEQNSAMMMFSGASVDEIEGGDSAAGDDAEYDYGVIATDGTRYSRYESHDALEAAGSLPYKVAENAADALKRWEADGYVHGIENVQTTIPFTSLDGSTRSTAAYVPPTGLLEFDDRWVLPLMGRGTNLGEWVALSKASVPDISAAIEQYNALASAAAPPTGMPTFTTVSAPVDEVAKGVREAPETTYPVYGSTPFTRFLARHLIAQTPVIDVSDYAGEPGVPEVIDAVYEAIEQNPYVINVAGMRPNSDGSTLTISYTHTADEAEAIQKSIHDQVTAVVGSVVRDGMSAAEKVTALNDWMTSNAEYDHAALNAKNTSFGGGVPMGFENAWNAKGVLVDGIGVCASYAYGFNALANAAGVETVVVTGDVQVGGGHAWNKVEIDGTWLAIDVTWNDSPQGNRYLMINDSQFVDEATRAESTDWMIDLKVADYATP